MLQRNQLAVQRHEGLHDEFRVQAPSLYVRTVERENRASLRYPALHHSGELHFVAGPHLVGNQRPGCRRKSEVVITLGLLSGWRRYIQRQHKYSTLAGIADQ